MTRTQATRIRPQTPRAWIACVALAAAALAGCPEIPPATGVLPIPGATVTTGASSLTADKAMIVADGADRAKVTITLKTATNTGLSGVFVTFASTSGGVQLFQPAGMTDVNGSTHAFLTATTPGAKVVTVSYPFGSTVVTLPFTVTVNALPVIPPGPTKMVFLQQPTDAVAGAAIAPPVRVALQNDAGQTVTTASGAVSIALAQNAAGVALGGTRMVMAENGIATFSDLSLDRVGLAYTLVVSAGTLPNVTSAPFNIAAGAPTVLAFAEEPGDGVAGEFLDPAPVLELRDRLGNRATAASALTLQYTATRTPADARCPAVTGTLNLAAGSSQVSIEDLSLTCSGAYVLTATGTGLSTATSRGFTVRAAAVDHFSLQASAATVTAGTGPQLTVTALDFFENVVVDFAGTVRFTSTDERATLPAATAFVTSDQGRRSFTGVTLRTAGLQTLTVEEESSLSMGQADVTVTAAAASKIAFTGPASGTVRAALVFNPPQVTDAFDNPSLTFTGPITLALTPSAGALTGTTTVNATEGRAAFADLAITNEGTGYTLTASTTTAGVASTTSAPFNVVDNINPATIATLTVTKVSPTSLQLAWTAPGDDGNLGTATSYELRTKPTAFGDGQQGTLVTGMPAPAAPGTAQTFVVTGLLPNTPAFFSLRAVDGAGNRGSPVFGNNTTDPCPTGYAGNTCTDCAGGYIKPSGQTVCVHVCTAQNPCTTPPSASCAAPASGQTFSTQVITRPNPGTCTPTTTGQFYTCDYPASAPTSCGANRICETTNSVGACVDSAPVFSISNLGASITAGASNSGVVVRVRDVLNNDYTLYRGTIAFTSTDTAATLPTTNLTFGITDNAQKSFSGIVFRTAGARTLTVTDTLRPTATTTANTTVNPAAPNRLAFVQQPSNANVRANLAPAVTVAVNDSFGNRTTSTTSVALALTNNPGTAVLGGTLSNDAAAGLATFANLSLDNEGAGYTLTASASGLTSAVSAGFTITDNVAPGPITDFAVDTLLATSSSLEVDWTTPGDDGQLGDLRATASYVIKFSKTAITEQNFDSVATSVTPPAILGQGIPASAQATGLDSDTLYFFALRVNDGAGNNAFAFASGRTLPCDTGYVGAQCNQCANGYVRDGGNLCRPICDVQNPCTTPPANSCADPSTLNVPPNPGACALSATTPFYTCDYTPTPAPCGVGRVCTTTGSVGACVDSPATYTLTGLSANVTAGASNSVTLTVRDAQGAVFTNYTGTVTFTATPVVGAPATAVLPANYTFVGGDAGVKVFTGIVFKKAGANTLVATDTTNALVSASANTTVAAAAATKLAFVQGPGAATVRANITPAVTVGALDAFDNPASADGTTVNIELGANPVNTTLGDTLVANITGGVATFGALKLNAEANGYTLVASANGLQPVTSAAFNVTDNIAPSTPTLTFDNLFITQSSIRVEWLAPGDDGALGDLPATASYVMKFGTTAITPANFATTGTVISTTAPNFAGLLESVTATGLFASTTYHFALQVNDGGGNTVYATASQATAACPTGTTGQTCQQCDNGYVQTGGPGVCTHVCTAANPCTAGQPANTCTTNTLNTRSTVCTPETVPVAGNYYSCTYPSAPTDCTATARVCLANPFAACVTSPCTGSSCTAIPATTCSPDGLGRITYGSTCTPTTHTAFTCDYPPTTTQCEPQPGAVCSAATCYATVSAPLANELVVTEIQHSPSSAAPSGEYFEVYNRTTKDLNIAGLLVTDQISGSTFQVPATPPVVVPAGTYFVFGFSNETATNGGITVNYVYPSTFLLTPPEGAQTGGIKLELGATVVDDFQWTTAFPGGAFTLTPDGRAMQLSSRIVRAERRSSRNKSWYWCQASSALPGATGFGTPGAANGDCGVQDGPAMQSAFTFCNIQFVSPNTGGAQKDIGSISTSTNVDLYSQLYIGPDQSGPGTGGGTTRNRDGNDDYPWLEAQFGYGAADDATTWTTWTAMPQNGTFFPTGFNNDEFQMSAYKFTQGGSWKFGFRYRLLDSSTGTPGAYSYCDKNGFAAGGTSTNWGTVTVTAPLATDLFISEYGEGNSNNKYIEIYNGTGAAVDLSGYSVALWSNGGATPSNTLVWSAGTMLANNSTRVLCHTSIDNVTDPKLAARCDQILASTGNVNIANFNGDDAVALRKGGANTIIDVVGTPAATDPGTSWTACGDIAATLDKILIRKPTVNRPNATWSGAGGSAGTSASDCEWTILPATTLQEMQTNNNMGAHTFTP